jgi:hypothetical protein
MSVTMACPYCGHPLEVFDWHCAACGTSPVGQAPIGDAAACAGADGHASAHKAVPDMRRRESGRASVLRRVQRAVPVVTRSG